MGQITTWIDTLLGKVFRWNGVEQVVEPGVNFTGAGVTVSDDPANDQLVVNIPGGGGSSGSVTVFTLDGGSSSLAKGDAFCFTPGSTNPLSVTKAVAGALTTEKLIAGIADAAYSPGSAVVKDLGAVILAADSGLGTASVPQVVGLTSTGTLTRISRPTGEETLVGIADPSGKVTRFDMAAPRLTPKLVYNVRAFGAVADADTQYGAKIGSAGLVAATDNLPFFQAAVAAIVASGKPGTLYIPAGVYYLSKKWVVDTGTIGFGIDIVGDAGDGFSYDTSTILVFPDGARRWRASSSLWGVGQLIQPTFPNDNGHEYVITIPGTSGSSEPTWPTTPGATVTSGGVTYQEVGLKSDNRADCFKLAVTAASSTITGITFYQPTTGVAHNYIAGLNNAETTYMVPALGAYGVVYRGTVAGGAVRTTLAAFNAPKKWEAGSVRARLGLFETGDLIFELITDAAKGWVNKPIRYAATNTSANAFGRCIDNRGNKPFTGNAPKFSSGTTYAVNDLARPTDGNWASGHYYQVSAITTGISGAEPSWPTTDSATVVSGGVTFRENGRIFPRDTGLGTLERGYGAGGASSEITWTLDDATSTQKTDPGDGTHEITWEVLPYNNLMHIEGVVTIRGCRANNALGRGCYLLGGTGTPVDGCFVNGLAISSCVSGWEERGGDVNAGVYIRITVHGAQETHIFADSFLGSTYIGCEISYLNTSFPGLFGYRCDEVAIVNTFIGCYVEGGTARSMFDAHVHAIDMQGSVSYYPGFQGQQDGGVLTNGRITTNNGIDRAWAANTKTYVGEVVSNGNYNYQVTVSTNGAGLSGFSSATIPPSWTTTIGGTLVEAFAGSSITYQNVGNTSSTVTTGNANTPRTLLSVSSTSLSASLDLMSDSPSQGWYGWCAAGVPTNGLLAINPSTQQLWFGTTGNYRFGNGASVRIVSIGAGAYAGSLARGVGDIHWEATAGSLGTLPYAGWYCSAAGTPGTWVKFGKLYDSVVETDDQKDLAWSPGAASDATTNAQPRSHVDAKTFTSSATATVATLALADGYHNLVNVIITAVKTDFSASASWKYSGEWLRNGATVTAKRSSTLDATVDPDTTGITSAVTISTTNATVQVGNANGYAVRVEMQRA